MIKWLSENGPWVVPLAAIVGTAVTVVFRLWQMSKIKSIDISSTPLRKRTVRVFLLLQSTGETLISIAIYIFILFLLIAYWGYVVMQPPTHGVKTMIGVLFFTSLGFAVAGAIVLFIGKLGYEWFKD